MKCLFRFFHSFKVGIHPKIEGGTVHKLLKQCVYTLRAKDGMFICFCSHCQELLHFSHIYTVPTLTCMNLPLMRKLLRKAIIFPQKMGMN